MKYRIMESHCMDPYEHYDTFVAKSDVEAKVELERVRKLKTSGMSQFYMERIDVEEKTTYIE